MLNILAALWVPWQHLWLWGKRGIPREELVCIQRVKCQRHTSPGERTLWGGSEKGLHSPLVWVEDSGSPSLRTQENLVICPNVQLPSQAARTLKQTNQFLQESTGRPTHRYTYVPMCLWAQAHAHPHACTQTHRRTQSALLMGMNMCPVCA